ncbi:MAG: nucleotidyltransferase domain-containing protein [Thermostichales cyanobacterium SZTDM-1c_bins_54]
MSLTVVAPELLPPQVKLLVLFGSRANGTAHAYSDWDVGYLGPEILSLADLAIYGQVAKALGIPGDRLDLVNLQRCSPLLTYVVAREGKLIFEAEPELFVNFQTRAWKRYADAAKFRYWQRQYIQIRLEEWRS